MEKIYYIIPTLNDELYDILINALKYYRVSNVEFAMDGELTALTYETIDFIENCGKWVEENKYELPKLELTKYRIVKRALAYYQMSCIEFSTSSELYIKLYEMINFIENNVEIKEKV